MKVLIVLSMMLIAAWAQQEPVYAPIPYAFNYQSDTEDGGQSKREESGDGAGNVRGTYTVTDLEGHSRTVDYVADADGFRATVRTNEPGTANLNPADVSVESSADDGGIAAAYSAGPGAGAGTGAGAGVSPPRPSGQAGGRSGNTRFVLVPANDPRARGYY